MTRLESNLNLEIQTRGRISLVEYSRLDSDDSYRVSRGRISLIECSDSLRRLIKFGSRISLLECNDSLRIAEYR